MNRAITLAFLLNLAVPFAASAATSNASNRFTVPGNSENVAAWYEAHRAGVLNSSNCRILEDRGHGEYKVQTNTPVGACQYIIRERREQTTTKSGLKQTTYRITLVRVLSGRLDNQTVTISMTELNGQTQVDMQMTTSVAGRLVPVRAVRNVQEGCLAGCERYMTSNVR